MNKKYEKASVLEPFTAIRPIRICTRNMQIGAICLVAASQAAGCRVSLVKHKHNYTCMFMCVCVYAFLHTFVAWISSRWSHYFRFAQSDPYIFEYSSVFFHSFSSPMPIFFLSYSVRVNVLRRCNTLWHLTWLNACTTIKWIFVYLRARMNSCEIAWHKRYNMHTEQQ